MSRRLLRPQSGFTIVEMVIVTCIIAVLASIAISSMREYSLRARITEVVMAGGSCKNSVQEGYPVRDSQPAPGEWGCESSGNITSYAGAVQTNSDGVIRITIQNMHSTVNGRHVFLVPAKSDGITALITPNDLGTPVRSWMCGSDWLLARNALPANCRQDMTTYASDTYN